MSGIRSKNTRPELQIRKALHKEGFRYRLHSSGLPGKPDLVFQKYKAVIFIHGCFWHGHECSLFKWPKSNRRFWRNKILGNKRNDTVVVNNLFSGGWRVLIVWECALKGKCRKDLPMIISTIITWLKSLSRSGTIKGKVIHT